MSEKKNVSVGRRVSRALFIGMEIGLFGGAGVYLLATGVNVLAAAVVVNPIAFMLMVLGGSIMAAVGVELSADIAS